MTKIVQLHRMSTSQAGLYTGPIGEAIVDTGSFGLRVQDGVTPGGYLTLMAQNNLSELADPAVARSNLGLGSAAVLPSTAFVAFNGALGTPTSGVLTNCTGLPLGSITGLATGVATFLATPNSANLRAALTDETGSGAAVFADNANVTNLNGTFGALSGTTLTATKMAQGMLWKRLLNNKSLVSGVASNLFSVANNFGVDPSHCSVRIRLWAFNTDIQQEYATAYSEVFWHVGGTGGGNNSSTNSIYFKNEQSGVTISVTISGSSIHVGTDEVFSVTVTIVGGGSSHADLYADAEALGVGADTLAAL